MRGWRKGGLLSLKGVRSHSSSIDEGIEVIRFRMELLRFGAAFLCLPN